MVYRLELEKGGKSRNDIVMRTPCDWKEAMIRRNESSWLSVAVGNTHYYWAMGKGADEGYIPTVFWTSTAVTEGSINSEDPLEALSNFVPHQIHLLLFGDASTRGNIDPLSAANANFQSSLRQVPDLTVYVQSTNNEHERGLLFLFSKIAHRMYGLNNYDFFSPKDGCYDSLGVDRAASVYCAYHYFKGPVLVLDGGTALTYTACDANGKLMGGGISPGLMCRFRALSDYCGKLPFIDFCEYDTAVKNINVGDASPFPVFATDTKTAMMTTTFQEISLHCQNIILHFLQELKRRGQLESGSKDGKSDDVANGGAASPNSSSTKNLPKVVMAGSDSRFLELLLEQPGKLVNNDFCAPLKDRVDFRVFRNGCHYALGKLLEINGHHIYQLSPDEELRARLVGQRVAKEFAVADKDGDTIYRGSVRQVKRGEELESDLFTVQFDDGDNEDFDFEEIYEALKLYIKVGEKEAASPVVLSEEWKEDRKKSAEKSTTDLKSKVALLQDSRKRATEKEKEKDEQQNEKDKQQNERNQGQSSSPPVAVLQPCRQLTGESHDRESPTEEVVVSKRPRVSPPEHYLGLPVAKYFEIEDKNGKIKNSLFAGKVVSFDGACDFWKVRYDDGDEEEFDEDDLKNGALLFLEKFGGSLPLKELGKLALIFSENKRSSTTARR